MAANKTKTIDSRISDAINANGDADRAILTNLLDEAFDEITSLEEIIKTETPRVLDLSNIDPDKSTAAITSAKLRIERLRLAIPQLQSRIAAIDAEKALAEWTAEADRHRAESNSIFDELEKHYPPFLAKMMDIYLRARANAAAFNELKRKAPPGADTWFEYATPHNTFWSDLQLPSWTKAYVTYPPRKSPADIAWEQQVAFTNAMVEQYKALDQKFAPNGGKDWYEINKIEQERVDAENEKREAELKAADAAARDEYYQNIAIGERKRLYGE